MRIFTQPILILALFMSGGTNCVIAAQNTKAIQESNQTNSSDASASDSEVLKRAAELIRGERGDESLGFAEHELARLMEEHYGSPVTPLLNALLNGLHEKQAAHHFQVALFNLNERANSEGAEVRLKMIIEKYPEYTRLDDVLYQLAILEQDSGRLAEAERHFQELVTRFKWSPRAKESKEKLDAIRLKK